MSDKIAAPQHTVIDCLPFHRTSEETVWGSAFQMRDACYKAILEALEEKHLKTLVVKSENGQYPPFIRLEAWKPLADEARATVNSRIRAHMQLQFEVRPYHIDKVVTTAHASVGNRSIKISERSDFSFADAVEWALYTVGVQGKPTNYRPFLDLITESLLSEIPLPGATYSNRVERQFRNASWIPIIPILIIAGFLLGLTGCNRLRFAEHSGEVSDALTIFALAGALVMAPRILRRWQKVVVSVCDRPNIDPRYLLMLDSWHTVIPGLAPVHDELKSKMLEKLSGLDAAGITTEIERYGFRTPNGFDERDRIVVSKGQGVAHIHIYIFGKDLFVGWNSYANWAQWRETRPISVRHRGSERTEYRGLETGVYVPNQFDLIDLNSLSELVHRDITHIVKTAMAEQKIDQEIDFTIVRGDREAALDPEKHDRRTKQDRRTTERRWRIS